MTCKISHIEYYLPENVSTIEDLQKEHPSWDVNGLAKVTGVLSCHVAGEKETAVDLALAACNRLFLHEELCPDAIDAIVSCTQSGDYILPGNASVLHEKLGLRDNALAFDINLACSGFVYGLAIANAFLNTYDFKNVLLVNADTYTKYVHPLDKSVRLLFGDGAAATLIQPSERGVIDIKLGSYGKGLVHFMIPAGGCRLPKSEKTKNEIRDNSGNTRTSEHIAMDGLALLSLTGAKVKRNINQILHDNDLTFDDIAVFVFHQGSRIALDTLISSLRVPSEKVYTGITYTGNTVSASIPIALKNILDAKKVKAGDKILLCGYGAGFSWGSAILEWVN